MKPLDPKREGRTVSSTALESAKISESLPQQTFQVKHRFRLFLSKLPEPLDRLAWIGLPNYRHEGWRKI